MRSRLLAANAMFVLFLAATFSAAAQVPYERIRDADREPEHWLTYSGNYRSERFSRLDEITPANVAQLKVAWVYQCSQGIE